MSREAMQRALDALGVSLYGDCNKELERFAALIREECAKAVDECRYVDYEGRVLSSGPDLPANEEIEKCAAAIRGMK